VQRDHRIWIATSNYCFSKLGDFDSGGLDPNPVKQALRKTTHESGLRSRIAGFSEKLSSTLHSTQAGIDLAET